MALVLNVSSYFRDASRTAPWVTKVFSQWHKQWTDVILASRRNLRDRRGRSVRSAAARFRPRCRALLRLRPRSHLHTSQSAQGSNPLLPERGRSLKILQQLTDILQPLNRALSDELLRLSFSGNDTLFGVSFVIISRRSDWGSDCLKNNQ